MMPSFERLQKNKQEYEKSGQHCAYGTCVTDDISFPLQFQRS